MKTALQMVIDVARALNVPEVTSLISGRVWQHQRPANSQKEDIVVNSLALTNQPLQQGVVNVNIHVPALSVTLEGRADNTLPNLAKMQAIEAAITPLLEASWREGFHTDIDEPGQPFQEGGTWYLNIRVNYYSEQSNFQNI